MLTAAKGYACVGELLSTLRAHRTVKEDVRVASGVLGLTSLTVVVVFPVLLLHLSNPLVKHLTNDLFKHLLRLSVLFLGMTDPLRDSWHKLVHETLGEDGLKGRLLSLALESLVTLVLHGHVDHVIGVDRLLVLTDETCLVGSIDTRQGIQSVQVLSGTHVQASESLWNLRLRLLDSVFLLLLLREGEAAAR